MKRVNQHPILTIPENRNKVHFFFNGRKIYGYEGEVVSSALIANEIKEFSIHKRDDLPQGIFCANGQCSHCTVIIDGLPLKSCVTPLREGMDIRTLRHLPDLPSDNRPLINYSKIEEKCDVLVIGGGPAGLTATIELAKLGFSVILVDDKEKLGGKLVLQTHKFFGSIEDCYAGTRGIDIAKKLEKEVRSYENVKVYTNANVVGIYKDKKAGIFLNNINYLLLDFEGIVVSAGAREKSLIFPGNNLPGIYGAGAFQTIVNRDLVKAAEKIFVVGSGNVGLIAAYHALQAGIQVVGICDVLEKPSGYKVHADKIRRMGVPIYFRHSVLSAEGRNSVEKVTIAKIGKDFKPLLETAKTFEIDTLLLAVGLTPVDEFYDIASKFGFRVIKTGDADEIAEASSAMFGGRIAGLEMAKKLGMSVGTDKSFAEKAEVLKSKPGRIFEKERSELDENYQPIIYCNEEIPCNPCISVCPRNSIILEENLGNIMDIPKYVGGCTSCQMCVAVCPGLAIVLARKVNSEYAEVILPHEFIPDFKVGDKIPLMSQEGKFLENAEVTKIKLHKRYKTYLVTTKVSLKNATKVAGIRVQNDLATKSIPTHSLKFLPESGIVCQCEMITVREIVNFIKEHNVRDISQLKEIRVGMGACGGKTCSQLLPAVFKMAGVDWNEVVQGTKRPLDVEVPMYAILNEDLKE
jgi:NADPH-dependent 2,4-dienoyl-CoA reductase/sulfur reductase-like enzyme/Na+-translocating ferredoxin:NAD+ oxidoreductase RNF subunit RnfB